MALMVAAALSFSLLDPRLKHSILSNFPGSPFRPSEVIRLSSELWMCNLEKGLR